MPPLKMTREAALDWMMALGAEAETPVEYYLHFGVGYISLI